MRNLQKVLSVSVLLIAAIPAQEIDLPTFSIDESQATIEWKINELKSAEISEASVTPPKISIAIKSKSKLEIERKLEQLRAMENNMTIHVGYVSSSPLSVDTEKDLVEIKRLMETNE